MQRRKLEELNLLDDFLFNAMLAYPDTGEAFIRKLLETLFDRKFPHLKIRAQESFAGVNTDLRGARLDVLYRGRRKRADQWRRNPHCLRCGTGS